MAGLKSLIPITINGHIPRTEINMASFGHLIPFLMFAKAVSIMPES